MFRWFYNFLYGSVPDVFECAYSQEESMSRLSAVCTDSTFDTWTKETAYGVVKHSEVVLSRAIPLAHNPFKPVFTGSFQHVGEKTLLVGKYSMEELTKVLMSCWFGFCILWTTLSAMISVSRGLGQHWWLPFAGLGMFGAGALLVGFGKWSSRNDTFWLSNVISNALSVKRPNQSPHPALANGRRG
jgi:hypothetical protein